MVVGALASALLVGNAAQATGPSAPDEHAPVFAPHDHSTHDHGDHHVGGHGPDPAPRGVDVRRVPTTEELLAGETSGAASTTTSSVPCYGDGVSGPRVQAVYAVASDRPDRYADVLGAIRGYAGTVDRIFVDSAAETGGLRHVRWATDASCQLDVAHVVVSSSADDSFSAMVSSLKAQGYGRTDRKYLIWADANVYCGVADMKLDDRSGSTNANNGGAMYARVDAACWGYADATEAHELMHMLGGVQASAPHASAAGHCTDESDIMCYLDGSGVTMSYPCTSSRERLFDCNHDDYFSTAPAAGSYLASHWNAAMNVYLEHVEPGATSGPAPAPSTVTETFTGSTSRKVSTLRHTFGSGAGALRSELSFGSKSSLTMTLRDAAGNALAQKQGRGPLVLDRTIAAGQYVIEVSGSSSVSYTLSVTHTSA